FDAQRVLPPPHRVFGISHLLLVRTDAPAADLVETLVPCELIDIENHLLRNIHTAPPPGVDRMFLSFFEACVIPIVPVAVGNRGIILLDASHELLIELSFEPLE